MQGDFAVERGRRVGHPVPAHHGGFDQVPDFHLDHNGYDAMMREIDASDGLIGFSDDFAEFYIYRIQVGFKRRKDVLRQRIRNRFSD